MTANEAVWTLRYGHADDETVGPTLDKPCSRLHVFIDSSGILTRVGRSLFDTSPLRK